MSFPEDDIMAWFEQQMYTLNATEEERKELLRQFTARESGRTVRYWSKKFSEQIARWHNIPPYSEDGGF